MPKITHQAEQGLQDSRIPAQCCGVATSAAQSPRTPGRGLPGTCSSLQHPRASLRSAQERGYLDELYLSCRLFWRLRSVLNGHSPRAGKGAGEGRFMIQPEQGEMTPMNLQLPALRHAPSQRWLLRRAGGTLKAHFPKHGSEYAPGGKNH